MWPFDIGERRDSEGERGTQRPDFLVGELVCYT